MDTITIKDGSISFKKEGYVSHHVQENNDLLVCHKDFAEGKRLYPFLDEESAMEASRQITEQLKGIEVYVTRLFEEWKKHGKIIVDVDFDDSLKKWTLDNAYDVQRTIDLARKAHQTGAYIVIFTSTVPERYDEIKKHCEEINLPIDSINQNPIPLPYGNVGKIYYNINLCDRSGLSQALDILEGAMYRFISWQKTKDLTDVG